MLSVGSSPAGCIRFTSTEPQRQMSEVLLHSVKPTATVRLGLWANCIRLSQKKQHRLLVPRPGNIMSSLENVKHLQTRPTDQHGLMDMLMSHSVPRVSPRCRFHSFLQLISLSTKATSEGGGGLLFEAPCFSHFIQASEILLCCKKGNGGGELAEVVCRRKASSMIQYLQGRHDQSY